MPNAVQVPRAAPLAPGQPFSVLLPVYANDDAAAFLRSFRSVTVDQTRRPNEVVIVVDGPVGRELDDTVAQIETSSFAAVTVHRLPENGGLGPALDAGLALCRNEIVARQDADDISLPTRFAVQVPMIERGADLVGSALMEFDIDPEMPGEVRVPPLTRTEIEQGARWHQPVFHPSVVYRRTTVQAGGYGDLPLLEDYWLFARMLHAGAVFANVAEPLVAYRVGEGLRAARWARHSAQRTGTAAPDAPDRLHLTRSARPQHGGARRLSRGPRGCPAQGLPSVSFPSRRLTRLTLWVGESSAQTGARWGDCPARRESRGQRRAALVTSRNVVGSALGGCAIRAGGSLGQWVVVAQGIEQRGRALGVPLDRDPGIGRLEARR